jgi:hypothetical protein
MIFKSLLRQLDALLQQHRLAYHAELFLPAAAEIAAFEAEFNLPLPPGTIFSLIRTSCLLWLFQT